VLDETFDFAQTRSESLLWRCSSASSPVDEEYITPAFRICLDCRAGCVEPSVEAGFSFTLYMPLPMLQDWRDEFNLAGSYCIGVLISACLRVLQFILVSHMVIDQAMTEYS